MLRFIIAIVFFAALVGFWLLNSAEVTVSLFIISKTMSVGLFAIYLGGISFVIGLFTAFVSTIGQWRKVRQASQKIRELEQQLSDLQSKYIALSDQSVAVHSATVTQPTVVPVVEQKEQELTSN